MSCAPHDVCLRTAEAVRADLWAACETLRAESQRAADGTGHTRTTWARIDESVGEITALLEILDETLPPPARAGWRAGAAAG